MGEDDSLRKITILTNVQGNALKTTTKNKATNNRNENEFSLLM